jgi:ubiquinone/menaquinone biosynthesis C-methylase UbiE
LRRLVCNFEAKPTVQNHDLILDQVNRRAWRTADAVKEYSRADGWLDCGEQAALQRAAATMRGRHVLDIGVGGGRTVPLMLGISPDAVFVDYTPAQVRACHARFPAAEVLGADARALPFPDASFDLVTFSFNGIDSVGPTGRSKVLAEVRRVLRPQGLFVFSSINRDGPSHGETFFVPLQRWSSNPLKLAWRAGRLARVAITSALNRLRYRRLGRSWTELAVANIAALNFGVVAMQVTLGEQVRQLHRAGFVVEAALDQATGRAVAPDEDTHSIMWFHYVARRNAGGR